MGHIAVVQSEIYQSSACHLRKASPPSLLCLCATHSTKFLFFFFFIHHFNSLGQQQVSSGAHSALVVSHWDGARRGTWGRRARCVCTNTNTPLKVADTTLEDSTDSLVILFCWCYLFFRRQMCLVFEIQNSISSIQLEAAHSKWWVFLERSGFTFSLSEETGARCNWGAFFPAI